MNGRLDAEQMAAKAEAAWDQMESIRRQRWQQSVGQRETPGDLVQLLRDRAYGCKIPDPLVEEAADEIERLRSRLRLVDAVIRSGDVAALTDAEREAIGDVAGFLLGFSEIGIKAETCQVLVEVADTLRGLLDRLR
jgi:hypothetical protein